MLPGQRLGARLEGAALLQVIHVVADSLTLTLQKPRYRIRKRWVRQPVRAAGLDRQQGAGHFVLTLGATFKAVVAMLYAPLQGLVVACFEMQAIDPLQCTPVAAIGYFDKVV